MVLPLGQLALCAVLILIVCGPRSLIPVRTRAASGVVKITFSDRASDPPSRRPEAPSDLGMRISGRVLGSIWIFNLPGGILQMEAAAYGRTHHGWIGGAMETISCSSLSCSVLCLPFWWIAGRGTDALIAMQRKLIAPRIHFHEAVISFVLLAGGILLAAVGISMFFSGSGSAIFLAALLLWSFLGGIGVRARYQQLRLRRSLANS